MRSAGRSRSWGFTLSTAAAGDRHGHRSSRLPRLSVREHPPSPAVGEGAGGRQPPTTPRGGHPARRPRPRRQRLARGCPHDRAPTTLAVARAGRSQATHDHRISGRSRRERSSDPRERTGVGLGIVAHLQTERCQRRRGHRPGTTPGRNRRRTARRPPGAPSATPSNATRALSVPIRGLRPPARHHTRRHGARPRLIDDRGRLARPGRPTGRAAAGTGRSARPRRSRRSPAAITPRPSRHRRKPWLPGAPTARTRSHASRWHAACRAHGGSRRGTRRTARSCRGRDRPAPARRRAPAGARRPRRRSPREGRRRARPGRARDAPPASASGSTVVGRPSRSGSGLGHDATLRRRRPGRAGEPHRGGVRRVGWPACSPSRSARPRRSPARGRSCWSSVPSCRPGDEDDHQKVALVVDPRAAGGAGLDAARSARRVRRQGEGRRVRRRHHVLVLRPRHPDLDASSLSSVAPTTSPEGELEPTTERSVRGQLVDPHRGQGRVQHRAAMGQSVPAHARAGVRHDDRDPHRASWVPPSWAGSPRSPPGRTSTAAASARCSWPGSRSSALSSVVALGGTTWTFADRVRTARDRHLEPHDRRTRLDRSSDPLRQAQPGDRCLRDVVGARPAARRSGPRAPDRVVRMARPLRRARDRHLRGVARGPVAGGAGRPGRPSGPRCRRTARHGSRARPGRRCWHRRVPPWQVSGCS